MSEKLLYGHQIRSGVQQVRGKTVPQGVRADLSGLGHVG